MIFSAVFFGSRLEQLAMLAARHRVPARSRMKGNERISARVQEVGRAAERAEVSLERVLRELKTIAFSNISKAVTWSCEEGEDGQRVKVLPVPSDKLDEDTAAAIAAVSQSSTGALRIKMHDKLAALVQRRTCRVGHPPGRHQSILQTGHGRLRSQPRRAQSL